MIGRCACGALATRIVDLGADGRLDFCPVCVPSHLALAVERPGADVLLRIEGADEPGSCTLASFIEANEEGLDDDELELIAGLAPGESYCGGGGAAAEWRVTRVEEAAC